MKQRLLKFVFLIVLGLLPALASAATDWTEDKMWADPVELMPGEETTFILHLENTQDNVSGVQVSFTLPEGVTVPTYYDEDMEEDVLSFKFVGREKGHDIASSFHNGMYKVLITSMKNNTLKNDKSDLLEITLKAADDAALGKYTIDFTGCLYATKTTDQYTIDDFEVDLSVYALIEAVNLSVNQLDVPFGKTIPIPMPTYEPEILAPYIDLSIELSEGAEEYVELDLENNTITGLKVTDDAPAIGIIYTATNTTYAKDTKDITLNISVAPQLPEDIQIWAPTTNGGTCYLLRWSGQWLAADVYPYDAYNKDIEWTIVSGEDVAYIYNDGWDEETEDGEIIHHLDWYVNARDVYGEAVVRATCVANPAVYAEFTVKVVESVDNIEITSGDEVLLTLEADLNPDMPEYKTSAQLTAKITPEKFENQKVYWYINDKSVATISDEGLVTAVGYGETYVQAYTAWPSEENQNSTTWSNSVRIEVKKVPTCTVTTQIPTDETITVEPEEEGKVNIKEQIDAVASDGSEVVYEVTTGDWGWIDNEETGNEEWGFVPNADYDPETGILTYKYAYSGEVTVKVYVPSESEDTYGSTPLYFTVFFNMAYPQNIYADYLPEIKYNGSYEGIYVWSDSGLSLGVELLEGDVDWYYYDWGSSVYVQYKPNSLGTIKFKFTQEGNYDWQPAEPFIATINVAKGDAVLDPYTYGDGEIFRYNYIYFGNNNYETPVNVEILEGEDLISDSYLNPWEFEYYANGMGWLKLRISQEGNENWNAPEPVEISVYISKAYQSVWTNWLPTTDFTVEENQLTPITFGSATSWMYDPELGYYNDEDIQWSFEVIDGNVQAQFITGEQVGVYEIANEEDLQKVGFDVNGEPVYQGIVYNPSEDNLDEANIFISPWGSYETTAFFQGTGTVEVTAYNPGSEYYYDYYNYWWLTFSDGTTGVEDVKVENVIKVEGRTITTGDGTQMLEVYNANGMTLYRGYDSTVTVPAAGIYIVRCGEKVSKIYVR